MTRNFSTLPQDQPQRPSVVERIRALSTGTVLVLAGGILLFFDLFLTWQTLEIDFGRAGTATQMLDGWDFWGLLVGFTTVAIVVLVVVVEVSDVEVSTEIPWELLAFALATTLVGLTIVKGLTDADSAWASYVGVALAVMVAVGAYLNWSRGWLSRLRRQREAVSSDA